MKKHLRNARVVLVPMLLFSLFVIRLNAQQPSLRWAKEWGGSTGDLAQATTMDAAGNLYVIGTFSGVADLDPGPGTAIFTTTGLPNVYVSKFDAAGNFLWAKQLGANSANGDQATGIKLDAAGNMYVLGMFTGTADFDPGSGIFNLSSPSLLNSIFITKLDPAGNFIWAEGITPGVTGFSLLWSSALAVDVTGNVYYTGYFSGTVDFDPGPGTTNLASTGINSNVFISKLDASGNLVWARCYNSTGFGGSQPLDLTVDATGNVYTTGFFLETVDFDPGPGTVNRTSSLSSNDIFVSKLDASGNFVWVNTIGSPAQDRGYSIHLDAAGNIYVTGEFTITVDFDPGPGTAILTALGSTNIFVWKLDAAGNYLMAKAMGGTGASVGNSITTDAAGNMFIAGNFSGTADFDPGIGTVNLTSSPGTFSTFLVKLNSSGNYTWVEGFGGGSSTIPCTIMTDPATGNLYLAGQFMGTTDFDPNPLTTYNLTSQGMDAFFLKLGPGIITGTVTGSPFCANSAVNVPFTAIGTFNNGNLFTAQLSDATGSFASAVNIGTLSGTGNGFSGTINAVIPANTPNGTHYHIRVVSSDTALTGSANSIDLTITATTPAFTTISPLCLNATAPVLPATSNNGITGTWNALVSTATAGTTTYIFTPATGQCATTATMDIIVNTNTTITLSSATGTDAQTICAGNTITNITYSIGGSGNNASITGGGLPPGVTGVYNAGVFTISGKPTSTGTYPYAITATGSCAPATISGTIIVNPNATITLSSATGTDGQTICAGNAVTNITYTIGGSGNNAAITTGSLPAGVTGAYNAGVFTISGTPAIAGIYPYTITSIGSTCTNPSLQGTITINAAPVVANITGPVAVCTGTAITLNDVTPGGVWSSSDPSKATIDNNGIVTGIAPGTTVIIYTVTNSCGTTTNPNPYTITINGKPNVAPITGTSNEICTDATLVISDATTGGVWSSSNTTIATVNSNVVKGVAGGTVTISYTVTGACGDSSVIYPVTINPKPLITVNADATICLGSALSLTAGTDASSTVQWNGNTGNPIIVAPVTTTTYTATATSDKACINTAAVTVTVEDFSVTLAASPNPVIIGQPFTLTTSSALPYQVISWQPANLFPNQTATSQTLTADVTRLYQVTAKTNEGCIDTDTLTVTVIDNGYDDVFVPNVFTPNGDGKNDVLNVKGTVIAAMNMRIYNQSGTLVFESNDQNKGWDGTYKGSQQPVGVYVYVLRVSIQSGITLDKKGSITLIR